MRVVVAVDAFKGCLSSADAGEAVAAGVRAAEPGGSVRVVPVAAASSSSDVRDTALFTASTALSFSATPWSFANPAAFDSRSSTVDCTRGSCHASDAQPLIFSNCARPARVPST